jgi:hypothetical protein
MMQALLLAHQKLKLRDEVSMFAIDHAEPLVTFSLSFGASSSPAVSLCNFYDMLFTFSSLQIARGIFCFSFSSLQVSHQILASFERTVVFINTSLFVQVRVYTAANVHDELQSALQDYARASVGVNARGKVLVPKLLFDFACDIVEESEITEWICQFLPFQQSNLIRNCIKHRQHRFLNSKHLSVLPFDFRFRYLFLLPHKQQTVNPVKL